MNALDAGLSLARAVRISNVWLLRHEGRAFIVDTGHALERPALWWSLRGSGLGPGSVDAVLLTHRHSDHAGNAAWLRERLRCPVVCAAADAPFLDGRAVPRRLAVGRAPFYQEALNHLEDRFPSRCRVDDTLEAAGPRWGFSVFPTPGHTEGSVMLHHDASGTLFAGDSIVVGVPPFRTWASLRLSYPGFSSDVRRNWSAVRDFLSRAPAVARLCSGHGPALLGGIDEAFRRLLEVEPETRVQPPGQSRILS